MSHITALPKLDNPGKIGQIAWVRQTAETPQEIDDHVIILRHNYAWTYLFDSPLKPITAASVENHAMPSPIRYQVDSRYTSRSALKEKLQTMFPNFRTSDFDIKVSPLVSLNDPSWSQHRRFSARVGSPEFLSY